MKKAIMVAVVAFSFLLGACGADAIETEVKANAANDFELEWMGSDYTNSWDAFLVVDETTGVNYIIVESVSGYGRGVGITPRYNADGSLRVSD